MAPEEDRALLLKQQYGSLSMSENDEPTELKREEKTKVLTHTQSSFYGDLSKMNPGSIPHSVVIGATTGVACGVAAYLYYICLWSLLELVWRTIPEKFIMGHWPEHLYVLYIPLVGYACALLVGLSVKYLGDPGDLAYVVKCVHEKGYIGVDHSWPMIAASQFTIIGGGSLGPEAPLVAISAAISGFISRVTFKHTNRNVVRKHTLMGMSGALSAFFGCPLGGALFSLEVTSRMGMEYFEHAVESIFSGEIALAVFRGMSGLEIGPIWKITDQILLQTKPYEVFLGILIGLAGAFIAFLFASFHKRVMALVEKFGFLPADQAIPRALIGGTFVILLGMLIPQTMFWGEYEFDTLSTLAPASTLKHVWPTSGLLGWEMNSPWTCIITGFAKLMAISLSFGAGYRGGYIFPMFAAGACFGRAISFVFPICPVQLTTLGMAAALNVSVTRTALATTLILCYLSGEQSALSGVMASSITALFATSYMPFIKTQVPRSDIYDAIYKNDNAAQIDEEDDPHNEYEESLRSYRGPSV